VARLFGEEGEDHKAKVALFEKAPAAATPPAMLEAAFTPVAMEVMVAKSVLESHI
jgi:hypothetical protein